MNGQLFTNGPQKAWQLKKMRANNQKDGRKSIISFSVCILKFNFSMGKDKRVKEKVNWVPGPGEGINFPSSVSLI